MTVRLILIAVIMVLIAGCNGDDSPAPTPAPTSPWGIQYSPGMPPTMAIDGDNYSFSFPQLPGSVHYVTRNVPNSNRRAVHMRFRVEGGDLFPTEGSPPARMRLFLQRRGDNLSGAGEYEHYRFWSGPVTLVSGELTVEFDLDPELWTSVYGQNNVDGFKACLENLESVGFTFGGNFAGHGVYTTSSAKFVLLSFEVY